MSDEANQQDRSRRMLLALLGALAGWGLLLGLGAYLGLDEQTPSHDVRRLLVWGTVVGAFLAMWLGALWLRERRKP